MSTSDCVAEVLVPPVAVHRHHRSIERGQQRDRLGPADLQIDAPPRRVVGGQDMADGVLGHRHGPPEQRPIEPAAHEEDAVANRLGVQPPEREMAVKRIARIGGRLA